ncbi:UNKNOWN [Stylonychia lemnae]|uniref:Uncharacterized protein n=1 Tax=Stylonychia lemnae TaxID=5949 RepID=A0A077ZUE0_STYLE|nr:UNKNOWN [Stylonychia lemnae]|eukprot:CDW72905.1 UNKNOWN [Stylonychia lemnae]
MRLSSTVLFLLSVILSISEINAKIFKPYCSQIKNKMFVFCTIDENCQYSDEYCKIDPANPSQFGSCVVNQDIYINNPCNWPQVEQEPPFDMCMVMRCMAGYYCSEGKCHLNMRQDSIQPGFLN